MMHRGFWNGVIFVGLFFGGIFALSSAVSSAIHDTAGAESQPHVSDSVEGTAMDER